MADQFRIVDVPGGDPNVAAVDIPVGFGRWEWWLLVRGDTHWDNPKCDRDLERKHLDQAKERGAGILDVGDLFCAMQGKYDKRADKSSVRPEHQHGDYLDRLVNTAVDYYAPYARNFIAIGQGNHESAIRSRLETNLTDRLVTGLRQRTGSRVQTGGYSGWLWLRFGIGERRAPVRLWYMHGYGGGGPVTADTIQAQRQTGYIENADIMVSGHTHDSWTRQFMRVRLDSGGRVKRREIHYIKTGTYKDEYRDGSGGWHVETGKPPKPLGAYWVRFTAQTGSGALRVFSEVSLAR